jgi:hypothetical protein
MATTNATQEAQMTTTQTLQRQLPNGNWIDCTEHAAKFIALAAAGNPALAGSHTRSEAEVVADLDAGKTLRYDTDWSDNIRREPALVAPAPAPVLVRCSCGHNVPRAQVMNASLGTACPRCYDRLSE